MVPAVITASASIVVAVLVFMLNRSHQFYFERRQVELSRINAQLRDLYGPLYALVQVNEMIWDAMKDNSIIPSRDSRIKIQELNNDSLETWKTWLNNSLMPINLRMRELIIGYADLIIENQIPNTLLTFCAHVSTYEVLLRSEGEEGLTLRDALIRHPGDEFVDYFGRSFVTLKAEQARLLALNSSRYKTSIISR
jgi:hypothetical protein